MKKRKQIKTPKRCFNCGSLEPGTREHVPSRFLFGDNPPPNLITVPACRNCNNSYSDDEELFMVFLLSGYHKNPLARELWGEKVQTAINKPEKFYFKMMLRSKIRLTQNITPAGLYLGDLPVISFEKTRINAVLTKVVKGLFYHHTRHFFEGKILSIIPDSYNPKFWKTLTNQHGRDFGDGSFRYWCAINKENAHNSWWCLVFFDRNLFFIITQPKQQ